MIRVHRKYLLFGLLWGSFAVVTSNLWGEQPAAFEKIGAEYDAHIRPLLETYCLDCHGKDEPEGDLDLESLQSLAEVRRHPRQWQKILFMLENQEMPPKDSEQLSAGQLTMLTNWVDGYLDAEAYANAGDPGQVVVRRLSNIEYDNTLRDLTGVEFQLTREFPADSAAGEGFTNAGESMVMSPALFEKYLAAAQTVANHVVLLPDGFRFSKALARRDKTDEVVDKILALYAEKTELVELRMTGGNRDGRIRWGEVPLKRYIGALVRHRSKLANSDQVEKVAETEGLNEVYLGHLARLLSGDKHSAILAQLRQMILDAQTTDASTVEQETTGIVDWIARWQEQLLTLEDIGQLFAPGQQELDPVTASHDVRMEMDSDTSELTLVAHGSSHDRVVWKNTRLEITGLGAVALRDIGRWHDEMNEVRQNAFIRTSDYLAAVAEVVTNRASAESLAEERELSLDILLAWGDYLNISIGSGVLTHVKGLITEKKHDVAGNASLQGWGANPPNLITNSSDTETAKIPSDVPPRSVSVHPSPSQFVGAGWKSPVAGLVNIDAQVIDQHSACGNGVEWYLVAQRGQREEILASGLVNSGEAVKVPPVKNYSVSKGEILSIRVGPRGGNHACDATQIELAITDPSTSRIWDLAHDVSADVHAGNPHADSFGNEKVWYFYMGESDSSMPDEGGLPEDSALARWRLAVESERIDEAVRLGEEVAMLLMNGPVEGTSEPDLQFYRQTRAVGSRLFGRFDRDILERINAEPYRDSAQRQQISNDTGIDPSAFDGNDLMVTSPGVLHITIPLGFTEGWTFLCTAEATENVTGLVQVEVAQGSLAAQSDLQPGAVILAPEGHPAKERLRVALDDFRALLPRAMCCRTIVPIDKVVTLVMYHREDDYFRRLLLTEAEQQRLDRLWQEVRYISQDALKIHDFYPLFLEFSTQGNDTHVFTPLEEPIRERAEAFVKHLEETGPAQLDALVDFAARAFRRPIDEQEEWMLKAMYANLRAQEEEHDAALRGVLARILVSPSFLYRIEEPGPGAEAAAVTDSELATRLSYFLWSSMPDEKLFAVAATETLQDPEILMAEASRMLKDERVRGLATEFACQWLGIRTFSSHDEKNEKQYPTFADVRDDMFLESVRFFEDLFQRDGSVLEILDADHTFMNEALAKHYGFDHVTGDDWRRVDGMKQRSRGGVLGMGAILAKQSGATRTSPVLRGNWVVETLLGEKLPDPPPTVPELPDALSREGLTVREMTERHVSDESCANCHVRIDPFGFALEAFDAIGRHREMDLIGKPVDIQVQLRDGTQFEGIVGLREYLLEIRRDEFLEQFCRKLLGFAVGRTVELSDQPLIEEMIMQLKKNDFHFSAVVETILVSEQFRFHRGLEATVLE